MASEQILVVDDEPQYQRLIRFNLEAEGYQVSCVSSAEEALEFLRKKIPDLVVLDIMLPGQDGFDVCSRIREISETPIIMLTALGGEDDKVRGLRLGADDYITKPFSAQELLARVEAVLRRAHLSEAMEGPASFELGDLRVDLLVRRVTIGHREVNLTPMEYRLLHYLVANAGKTVTQDDLLVNVWGQEYRGEQEVLRVTVWRLRQKLGDAPAKPRFITTVPGVGYILGTSS